MITGSFGFVVLSNDMTFLPKFGEILSVNYDINPLNAELNPICHLLALLGGATIVVVSRLRVNIADTQTLALTGCLLISKSIHLQF